MNGLRYAWMGEHRAGVLQCLRGSIGWDVMRGGCIFTERIKGGGVCAFLHGRVDIG